MHISLGTNLLHAVFLGGGREIIFGNYCRKLYSRIFLGEINYCNVMIGGTSLVLFFLGTTNVSVAVTVFLSVLCGN